MKKYLWLVLFAVACAGVPQKSITNEKEKLQSVDNVKLQNDLKKLNYKKLAINTEASFNFDDGSAQVYVFKTGRSYFHAFELPKEKTFTLSIESIQTGSVVSPNQRTIFYPTVMLLDKNYEEITRFNQMEFVHTQRPFKNDGMKTQVTINRAFLKAQYMIIMTEQDVIGSTFSYFVNEGYQARQMDRHTEINEYSEGIKYTIPYNYVGKVILKAL